jgi:hypothetical protein
MLNKMEKVGQELDDMYQEACREGWNLLVAALGAECEAWREAEDVLRQMAGNSRKGKEKESLLVNGEQEDHEARFKREDTVESAKTDGTDGTVDLWATAPASKQSILSQDHEAGDGGNSEDNEIALEGLKLSGGTPKDTTPKGSVHVQSRRVSSSKPGWSSSPARSGNGTASSIFMNPNGSRRVSPVKRDGSDTEMDDGDREDGAMEDIQLNDVKESLRKSKIVVKNEKGETDWDDDGPDPTLL